MSHLRPPESVRAKRLAMAGCWPTWCPDCQSVMQFAYGPGQTVQDRAAGAYRRCECGRKVTAHEVMRGRTGHSET